MKLIPNWKQSWRLWSVRLAALLALLSALEPLLPELSQALPPRWYAYLALAIAISRVVKQKDLP